MNKTELIAAVANEAEITKKDAEKAVKAVFSVISDSLTKGDKVRSSGLVLLKSVSAKPAKAATRATTNRFRSKLPRPRLSKLANSSKIWSTTNKVRFRRAA